MGKLVVIEGMDGAGTTTQSKLLVSFLEKQGSTVYLSREPRRVDIGKIVREKLIRSDKYSPKTIALGFAADRMQHIDEIIKPKLKECDFVILDRYYHSSLAYQPLHGCELSWVKELNRFVIKPDITFILNIPVEEFIKRRGKTEVIFEDEEFQKELRKRYLELPKILDENIVVIDGTRSIEEIHKKIKEKVVNL